MPKLQVNDEIMLCRVAGARRSVRALVFWGLASWLLYAGVAWLSRRFTFQTPGVDRPIVEVLLLLAAAFVVYLLALRTAVRAADSAGISAVVLIFAVAFRLLLLFTEPIQEVDIYRYLWDGQVTRHGVNPFLYTPRQVLSYTPRQVLSVSAADAFREKDRGDQSFPADFSQLVALRDSSPAHRDILSRVHFAELPTVYPPVSQAVFALAALSTPLGAGIATHVIVMKVWIVAFDVATIWILAALLKLVAKPMGWLVAYAWCPLVLKEFANSGHLDAIAVCLTTLAVYLAMKSHVCPPEQGRADRRHTRLASVLGLGAPAVLGLAVGAKLYPVVLAPLLVAMAARRFGLLRALGVLAAFLVFLGVSCWPQFGRGDANLSPQAEVDSIDLPNPSPPVPPRMALADPPNWTHGDANAGLKAFLSRWKMNDFLFLIVIENLTPRLNPLKGRRAWFVVTSERWRDNLTEQVATVLPFLAHEQIPFLLARAATATVFVILLGWFIWRASDGGEPSRPLEAVFLTLAWFFLLLPTQNPWYWTWVLPFVPFARGRAWLLVSGLLSAYYLRFWLGYHWPDRPVPLTTYPGTLCFDYVVTWLEFGPWFVWLLCSAIRRNAAVRTDANSLSATPASKKTTR